MEKNVFKFAVPTSIPQSRKRERPDDVVIPQTTENDNVIKNIFLEIIDPEITKTKLIENYNKIQQIFKKMALTNNEIQKKYPECDDINESTCTKKSLCSYCIALIEYFFKQKKQIIFQHLTPDKLNQYFVCKDVSEDYKDILKTFRSSWKEKFNTDKLNQIYSTLNSNNIDRLYNFTSKYFKPLKEKQCKAYYLKRLLCLLYEIARNEKLKKFFSSENTNNNEISETSATSEIPEAVLIEVPVAVPLISELKVFIENDTTINEEEKQIIFKKQIELDARQHLTVQRFTKFKCSEDKACFLFHGVGTGKTLTSLAIALNHLTSKNETIPLKILIIAPQGLFNASFNKDGRSSGIYTYNYTEYNGIESLNCIVKIDEKEYLIDLIGVNYFSLIDNHVSIFRDLDDINVLICDEAHHLLTDNLKGRQVSILKDKSFLDLIEKMDQHIFLTGTPIQKSVDDIIDISIFLNTINKSNHKIFESDREKHNMEKGTDGLYKVFNRPYSRDYRRIIKELCEMVPTIAKTYNDIVKLNKGGSGKYVRSYKINKNKKHKITKKIQTAGTSPKNNMSPHNNAIVDTRSMFNGENKVVNLLKTPDINTVVKIVKNQKIMSDLALQIYGNDSQYAKDEVTSNILASAIIILIGKSNKIKRDTNEFSGGMSGGSVLGVITGIITAQFINLGANVIAKIMDYLWKTDIDLLVEHTKPFVSVYNYDYNNFAIDSNEYYKEIQNLKEDKEDKDKKVNNSTKINNKGNKNTFPNKHIMYIPIKFTKQQIKEIDDLNMDELYFSKSNEIGCGCDVLIEKKDIIQSKEFVFGINKENFGYTSLKPFEQLRHTIFSAKSTSNYCLGINIPNNFLFSQKKVNAGKISYKNELFDHFETKIGNYLPNETSRPASLKYDEKYARFGNILNNLLVIRSGYVIYKNQYEYHPHYLIYKKEDQSELNIEYYLPVIYPTSMDIMYSFCNFLENANYKYLIMDSSDPLTEINKSFSNGSSRTFPIQKINELSDSPICIIISPTHTEGFSFVFNPAILLPGLCLTSGDQEQVYGRVLRKYGAPATDQLSIDKSKTTIFRYDKIIYQYFGSDEDDIKNIDKLSVLYATGNTENGISNFTQITDTFNFDNLEDVKKGLIDYYINEVLEISTTKIQDQNEKGWYMGKFLEIGAEYAVNQLLHNPRNRERIIKETRDAFNKYELDELVLVINEAKKRKEQHRLIEAEKAYLQGFGSPPRMNKEPNANVYKEDAIEQIGNNQFRGQNMLSYQKEKFVTPTIKSVIDIADQPRKLYNTAHIYFKNITMTKDVVQAYSKTLKKPVIKEFMHFEHIDKISSINNQYFIKLLFSENNSFILGKDLIVPMDLSIINEKLITEESNDFIGKPMYHVEYKNDKTCVQGGGTNKNRRNIKKRRITSKR